MFGVFVSSVQKNVQYNTLRQADRHAEKVVAPKKGKCIFVTAAYRVIGGAIILCRVVAPVLQIIARALDWQDPCR